MRNLGALRLGLVIHLKDRRPAWRELNPLAGILKHGDGYMFEVRACYDMDLNGVEIFTRDEEIENAAGAECHYSGTLMSQDCLGKRDLGWHVDSFGAASDMVKKINGLDGVVASLRELTTN